MIHRCAFMGSSSMKTTGFISQSGFARISLTISCPKAPAPYTRTRLLRLLRAAATRLMLRNEARVATIAISRSRPPMMKTTRAQPAPAALAASGRDETHAADRSARRDDCDQQEQPVDDEDDP